MAVHLSVAKRLRQSHKARLRNRSIKSQIKNLIKKVETSPDPDQAQKTFNEVVSLLDRATRQKVIHKNTATRIKTRLAKQIKEIESSPQEKKD